MPSVKPFPQVETLRWPLWGLIHNPVANGNFIFMFAYIKAFPSSNFAMPPKDDKRKKDARMSAKKGKDPVNKSGVRPK